MDTAQDFELPNAKNEKVRLSDLWKKGPLMVVFYPGDFTPVCTAQLCDYRDKYAEFRNLGIQMVAISPDPWEKHAEFEKQYNFPFPLLADPESKVVKAYKCTSMWTLGFMNRSICIINTKGEIVWRHVEAVAVTRRKAEDLQSAITKLRSEGKI